VEDEPDRWVPPGSDAESGAALSAAETRRGEEARGAGCPPRPRGGLKPGTGPMQGRKGKGGRQAVGGKEKWAEPKGGREEILFHFLNSYFAQNF